MNPTPPSQSSVFSGGELVFLRGDQVSRLLKETPGMRPDLWKLLLEQIGKGVSRRRKVEQNTDD